MLVFTIVGAALTLLAAYGAIMLSRKLFLSGICYFSFLPIIGESITYNSDKGSVRIMVIALYLSQFLLTLPNNIVYGNDNVAATKLSTKIGLALLVINIAGAVYVLFLKSGVPAQFGYYHVVIALAIVYVLAKRVTGAAWLK
jgi:hypothetical protein